MSKYKSVGIILLLLVIGVHTRHLINKSREQYSIDRLANIIWIIEGGDKTRYPYGIKGKWSKSPRVICKNTINNRLREYRNRWTFQGDFIDYLSKSYCPQGADHWAKMVKNKLKRR